MSELIYNEKGFSYLKGVTLTYVCLTKPQLKYESTDKEYLVEVTFDKATYKAWKKIFKKNTPREIENADYEKYKKITAPFQDQDEQYVYKFKVDEKFSNSFKDKSGTEYAEGDLVPKTWLPKVLLPQESGELLDITWDKMVANGSTADIAFKTRKNAYGGLSIKLDSILLDNFIEFESTSTGAFGAVVGSSKPAQQPAKEEETPKATPEKHEQEPDFDDDSIPF